MGVFQNYSSTCLAHWQFQVELKSTCTYLLQLLWREVLSEGHLVQEVELAVKCQNGLGSVDHVQDEVGEAVASQNVERGLRLEAGERAVRSQNNVDP